MSYRLTCDEFDRLIRRARHRCEICRRHRQDLPRTTLVIDHDHQAPPTAVRGLLCNTCNTRIGGTLCRVFDEPGVASYLRRPPVYGSWTEAQHAAVVRLRVLSQRRTADTIVLARVAEARALGASNRTIADALDGPSARWHVPLLRHA